MKNACPLLDSNLVSSANEATVVSTALQGLISFELLKFYRVLPVLIYLKYVVDVEK